MNFNEDSRQKNALLASASGVIEQVLSIVVLFVYRTIFLYVLSKEYLGIEGLFTNILQLFSLAELGIGSAILFRMYKPFAERDVDGISAYVHFYKSVYHGIAIIITLAGACLFPFITSIVDMNEVPADVNIYVVYALFVLQSVSSYLFVYKQAVVLANQRGYIVSIMNSIVIVLSTIAKIVILLITRKYEAVLLGSIVTTVLINWIFSRWITVQYKEVFANTSRLSKNDKKAIVKDTSGLLCHKIGYVVLTSTDNIVLTKMVSLAAVGIYTNYATIMGSVTNLLTKLLSSFIPTIGNFVASYEKEAKEDLYNKLLFVNLWLASLCSICLFVLLNPFIEIWLDETYLLSRFTVIVLCAQFYIKACQSISNAFINGAGLFARDRIRPLIESALNLLISIILAKEIGIAGVFIGTCISSLATCFWREPYLLYKHVFQTKAYRFVKKQISWLVVTCVVGLLAEYVCAWMPINLLGLIGRGLVCAVGVNLAYVLIWYRTSEFKYFWSLVKGKAMSILRRK